MAKAKKLPSGNWRVQAYANGQRRSFTAPTKKEAELMALEWINGKRGETDSRTVGECIDDYINAKENILSPSTIDGYKRWKHNCLDSLCDITLDCLTPMHVQKAMNELALTKSPKTVRNAHGLLVSVLGVYAPEIRLRTTLPPLQKKIKQLPPVESVLKVIIGTDVELPCMLAIWCGMRMSEIRGAKKSDIRDSILTIHSTVVTIDGDHIEKESTKTYDSTRQIRLSEYIMDLIDDLPDNQDVLTKLSGQAIYKRFSRLLECNGIEHMTFHDLRHMNASVMLALGIPDKYAMERGGWSSPNIMKSVYQHTFSTERENADRIVDNFFEKLVDDCTQNFTHDK